MKKRIEYTKDEERALIRRAKAGNRTAERLLLEAHEPFMISVAKHYSRVPGYEFEDAMQQARIGLVDGIKRFNLKKDVRFITYAAWRVRFHVEREMQNTIGDLRVPVYQQNKKGVRPVRALRLDMPLRNADNHEGGRTLADTIIAEVAPPDEQVRADRRADEAKVVVRELLTGLSEREMVIVREHLCRDEADKVPLAHLGRRLGVSRERMRQVRDELVVKLRQRAKRMGVVELLAA